MSRTRSCGWCGHTGHNQRTCPRFTQSLKEGAERELAGGMKDGACHRKYARRTGGWLDGRTSSVPLKQHRKRSCGYCSGFGHNVRTCPTKAVQYKEVTELNQRLQVALHTLLNATGIGRGSLIKVNTNYKTSDPAYTSYRVTMGLAFNNCSALTQGEAVLYVVNPATGAKASAYFPNDALLPVVEKMDLGCAMDEVESEVESRVRQRFNETLKGYGYTSIEVIKATDEPLPVLVEMEAFERHCALGSRALRDAKLRVKYAEELAAQLNTQE